MIENIKYYYDTIIDHFVQYSIQKTAEINVSEQ